LRKFIFRDTEKNTELVLPVTPAGFEVSHGIKIETINIHTLGDVNIAGYGTLAAIKIDCLLPAQSYSFLNASGGTEPYSYVEKFRGWSDSRMVLRFIVSGTSVNIPVIIEDIVYGERDGTGDVYATLSLREYRELAIVQKTSTENNMRIATVTTTPAPQTYTIKSGDTLSAICRKFYGDSSLYPKLAKYNGVKNPNLIYAGNTLKLPSKNLL